MGAEALLLDKNSDGNNNHEGNILQSNNRLYYLSKPGSNASRLVNDTLGIRTAQRQGIHIANNVSTNCSRSKSKTSTSSSSSTTGVHSNSVSSTNSNFEEKIIPVTLVPTYNITYQQASSSNSNTKLTHCQNNASNPSVSTNHVTNTTIAPTNCLPFSPQDVLRKPEFSVHLTHYEKKEISDFSEIYFIGKIGIKKRTPQTPSTQIGAHGFESKVYGFDDNNGSFIPTIHDHIAYRYEIQNVIGKGTFGIVLQAYDHKLQCSVALKVIRNQARFHTQAKEEIKILTKLLENDPNDKFNVVHMYETFMFRQHPCIVFELLSLNLYELSRKNSFNGFNLSLIRRFTFAIVKCLHALSKYDIIHCDLKPENILLKQHNRSGIKVIDFGSSCFANKRIHTYIQSRYYRSPEVILGGKYGPQIDMWSLGCILAELYLGRPLLNGENEKDQLACMIELLGLPPSRFVNKCKSNKVRQFFDSFGNPVYCATYHGGQYRPVEGRSPRGKIRDVPGSRALLPGCRDNEFLDFIRQCLIWDPSDRMTPTVALKHPWLTKRTNSVSTDNAVFELMSQ